jgi:tetratricopeptide (TPR) repeat protein
MSNDERSRLDRQTARNLEGMDLERAGRVDEAMAVYEQNVAEGFEGDWPYGRLVAILERRGELQRAVEVLERAIEVFGASTRRTATDRRSTIRAFKGRLRLVRQEIARRERAARKAPQRSE